MDRRTAVALTVVMLMLACPAARIIRAQTPTPAAPTDVVATVGLSPIFRSELDAALRRAAGGGAIRGVTEAAGAPGGGPGRRQWLEAAALEQLIDMRLLRAEIERETIVVGRLDVDGRIAQLKKQWEARGVDWQRYLERSGIDEPTLREQVEFEISLDKLIRPKLTPAAIASGFQRHRRELDGTKLRVSHVILRPNAAFGDEGIADTLKRAAVIRSDILQGTTKFADAARLHSAGPSRARGGDIGWISRDGPLLDAFAKQVFALAKGDVSKPFMTPFGIHLVQVTAVEPGRATLDMLRPKIETLLAGNLLRETLTKLRATTPVTYTAGVARFDPATPADGDMPRRILVGDAGAAPARP